MWDVLGIEALLFEIIGIDVIFSMSLCANIYLLYRVRDLGKSIDNHADYLEKFEEQIADISIELNERTGK